MPFLRLLGQRETKQKKYLNEPCKIGSVFLYYNVIVPQNQGLFGTFFLPRSIFFHVSAVLRHFFHKFRAKNVWFGMDRAVWKQESEKQSAYAEKIVGFGY